ncbi:MAG: DUF3080 family protein [Halioglobus sp.]|nr:DUF3080 family protein [Halioglobus sp.]
MRQRLDNSLKAGAPALCLCWLAILAACHAEPGSPFRRYLNQLALALPPAAATVRLTDIPAPPVPAALQLPITASPADSLDLLQVSGCAVQANIGRRATSLGRFAKPSQRLLLELEFLQLAPACIRDLREENRTLVASQLEVAQQSTRLQLPALVFNATLASAEFRAFWLATPLPGSYPRSQTSAATSALAVLSGHIQRWLGGDYRAHNRDLELLLGEIAAGDGGARLQSWTHQVDWLAAADRIVAHALARPAPCHKGPAVHLASRRTAIATRYYSDTIQPLIEQSRRRYLDAAGAVSALEALLAETLSAGYRQWSSARYQREAALASAGNRHQQRLRQLGHHCTLSQAHSSDRAASAEIGYTGR